MTQRDKDSKPNQHEKVKDQYDEAQAARLYEEGMALYHGHCQDPVIFRVLGDIRGKALLDLACFYTRKFRQAGADPVVGIDLSRGQVANPQSKLLELSKDG